MLSLVGAFFGRDPLRAVLVGLILACLVAYGINTVRLTAANHRANLAITKLAAEEAEWAKTRAAAAEALAAAEQQNRDTEQRWQAKAAEQQKGLADAKQSNEKLVQQIARIRVDTAESERMRGQLAAFASSSNPSADTVAACESRAERLAALLARGYSLVARSFDVAQRCAVAHDDRAAEVEALLNAWPAN